MTDETSVPADSAPPNAQPEVVPPVASDIAPEVPQTETVASPIEPVPVAPEIATGVPATETIAEPNEPTPVSEPVPDVEPSTATEQTLPATAERAREERLERPAPAPSPNIVQELLIKARANIQARKRRKLDTIVVEIGQRGKISNFDVKKRLRVSDATAARYLAALVKEGRIKRVGSTGRGVFYTIS